MGSRPDSRIADGWLYTRSLPAFTFGPVADTAEPVAAQAGVVGAEPDRDDGDTVPHGR